MTQLSATRGAPASSEIRNNSQLGIAGSQQLTELESVFTDIDRAVGDSFTRQTVIFHSDAACQFVGDVIENADSSIEIRIMQTDTGAVHLYAIPAGQNIPLTNDGDMVYAILARDGSGTGTVPSTTLTYSNNNLVSNVQTLPALENQNLFYIPLVMRIDGALGKKYAHWFFGHGVWAEGSSAQIGLAGTADDPKSTASLFSLRAERRWQASVYEYFTDNIIARYIEERIDQTNFPYTAVLDDTQRGIDFANIGDQLTSINMLDPVLFLPKATELYSVEIQAFYNLENPVDENAIWEVARDGDNFSQVNMSRLGSTDLFVGTHYFEEEPSFNYNDGYATQNSTIELNATNNRYIAQQFLDNSAVYMDNIELEVTKQGAPAGSIRMMISKDDGGAPLAGVNRILLVSDWIEMSDLSAGAQTVAFKLKGTVPQGSYHILLEADEEYYDNYTVGDKVSFAMDASSSSTSINTSVDSMTWLQQSNQTLFYQVEGRSYDLRVRVTGQTELANLQGFTVSYGSQLRIERGFRNRNVFTFSDNSNEFVLDYVPDKNSLACYVRGTGQVFREGDFTVSGKTVTFPVDFFEGVGTVTIEFIQQYGFSVDDSSKNTALLQANHLGSPDADLDQSVAGRGIFLRRPDGTLRELTINDSDGIDIYSV
jgi:hypothetical protein